MSTGITWISLGHLRTFSMLDEMLLLTQISNHPLFPDTSFLKDVLNPGNLNCPFEKGLSNFVSLTAIKSTRPWINSNKLSNQFVSDYVCINMWQTYFWWWFIRKFFKVLVCLSSFTPLLNGKLEFTGILLTFVLDFISSTALSLAELLLIFSTESCPIVSVVIILWS